MFYDIPGKLAELAHIFKKNGYSLYLVGGAVRDYVLGNKNHDYDFTTDAEPLEVKAMFKRTIDTGIKHGTVTVLYKGESYEITTFRTEGDYTDNRHPDSVKFVKNLEEDLKRRDFTINALAADLFSGEIIDMNCGLQDLKDKKIRAIGNPTERFSEDALRMLRACRFSSKLDFEIDKNTLEAIAKLQKNVLDVSSERIKEEFFKLVDGSNPIRALEYMRMTGLMETLFPELYTTIGVEQRGFHNEDVYTHLLLALKHANKMHYPLDVKMAALFHDIGKPETRAEGKDRFTFYSHEVASEKITRSIMTRLKASNKEKEDISHLVREHMFSYTPDWTDAAIRRFINRVGIDYLDRLFMLRNSDLAATTGDCPDSTERLEELKQRINKELDQNNAMSIKDLHINGNDLIKLGIPKGKEIGKTLSYLLERVIEQPELNTNEKLTAIVKSLS